MIKEVIVKYETIEKFGALLLIVAALLNLGYSYPAHWLMSALYLGAIFCIFVPTTVRYKKKNKYFHMILNIFIIGLLTAGLFIDYRLAGVALLPLLLLFILDKTNKRKEKTAKEIPE